MQRAITREVPYDQYTPITAYNALGGPGACILESTPGKDRYSYVGFDPMASIEGKGDAVQALRAFRNKHPMDPESLYTGACIGYLGYDGSYLFQIYRSGVTFDHKMNRAVLSTFGDQEELERLYRKLKEGKPMSEAGFEAGPFQPDISDEAFEQMVEKAKEHLRRGDAFQIVLSRTFRAEAKGEPLEFYRSLRKTSPAPYLFFFDLDRFAIGGASPEKIVSVQGGIIESMPIAGTCQKGGCPSELLSSVKETAEHMMLVDLARNDVGRVASPGTVRVAELKAVHEFSHVDHIVSRIVGKLDPRFDALDALDASFPAGTLTGAPKKRAMEIIDAIEPSKRGLYGGAIIAFEANGNLTSCIAIRTAIIEKGTISVQAGAGIVIDSDPKKEALETVLKAQSAMEAGHATYHR